MTPHDHDQTHDRDQGRDKGKRARDDRWSALTGRVAADPPRAGRLHEHRPLVHRGPDGRLYHGCVVPPAAVPVRGAVDDTVDEVRTDQDRHRRDHPIDHAAGDLAGPDDGAGW